jgi:hypothetical protein
MEPSKNEIRREIEATRAAMAEKIETLEARVGDVIQGAKRSVDPKYQTQRRPWQPATCSKESFSARLRRGGAVASFPSIPNGELTWRENRKPLAAGYCAA